METRLLDERENKKSSLARILCCLRLCISSNKEEKNDNTKPTSMSMQSVVSSSQSRGVTTNESQFCVSSKEENDNTKPRSMSMQSVVSSSQSPGVTTNESPFPIVGYYPDGRPLLGLSPSDWEEEFSDEESSDIDDDNNSNADLVNVEKTAEEVASERVKSILRLSAILENQGISVLHNYQTYGGTRHTSTMVLEAKIQKYKGNEAVLELLNEIMSKVQKQNEWIKNNQGAMQNKGSQVDYKRNGL